MESIDNVFRQHSQGNSDKFFRKGKRSTSSASTASPVRFIKRREERKTMQPTNLTFSTPKGMGVLALMFATTEFVSCERL